MYWRIDQVEFMKDNLQKITSNFLKVVFHKFYQVHYWISWPICTYFLATANNFLNESDFPPTFWWEYVSRKQNIDSFVEVFAGFFFQKYNNSLNLFLNYTFKDISTTKILERGAKCQAYTWVKVFKDDACKICER